MIWASRTFHFISADSLGPTIKLTPLWCAWTWSFARQSQTVCTPTFCFKVLPLKTLTTAHLLLGLNDVKPGRKCFHFEAFWLKIDGFLEAVQQAWNSVQPNHCPLTLDNKFKVAARGLQAWSDKKVGHIESQLTLAREILHQLEIAQDLRLLSHLELELKNNLKKHSLALTSFM
jgi:hypothetical protein